MSGPRAEDVKEAIEQLEWQYPDRLGKVLTPIVAAAELWLASQEQTPGITDEMVERAALSIYDSEGGGDWGDWKNETILRRQMWLDIAREALEAALVGFHPQAEGEK